MTHTDLTRAEAFTRSQTVSLNGVTVELDLRGAPDPAQATFGVKVTWDFRLQDTAPAASTFLDFIGDVHTVELNGQVLSAAQLATAVHADRIHLDGLSETNRVVVEGAGYYSRSGEGLHRYVDPQDAQTYLYTQYEPTDARRVVPCFDQPDLRTTWHFDVIAPAGWSVSSNALPVGQRALNDDDVERGAVRHSFGPTASIPSYLTSVLAGPYHRVDASWTSSHGHRPQTLPLTLWCRASMAEYLPAEELFDLTRQGLDFFTELFDLEFPFDSYEQAFVPEYNLGAMENPGLVTLTEDYLFPDGPTHQQRAARANTVLHEMAHMYFGDLVTIRWWEDLWLKESFAEFMGAHASASATEFTQAWAGFAVQRKAWAYRQDSLSTTHPIVADVPDVAAAQQNFDGITYAKGAAALKQLVAYVGIDEFTAACRQYFRQHAWASASLLDFLTALEASSSRDTGLWAQKWLTTEGATVLRVEQRADTVAITPLGTDTDPNSRRPHHLRVGVYHFLPPGLAHGAEGTGAQDAVAADSIDTEGTTPVLTRTQLLTVDVASDHPVGEALVIDLPPADSPLAVTGEDSAALIPPASLTSPLPLENRVLLLNDDDLDYAHFHLDPAGVAQLKAHLSALPTAMARSVAWAHLWSMLRRGHLLPEDFLAAVIKHVFLETESVVFETVLDRALETLESYVGPQHRAEQRRTLSRHVAQRLRQAAAGSDQQTALARILGHLIAHETESARWVRQLMTGAEVLPGLELGPALRWRWMTGLVASNQAVESWIREEADRDHSRASQIGQARTLAARPTHWAKEAAWQNMLNGELSNDLLSATAAGFQLADDHLMAPYRDRYFAMLEQQWSSQSTGMATRLVKGLYPRTCDLVPGTPPEEDPLLGQTQDWLENHPEAPAALRRLILEQRDERRIRLRIQANARR
ncbi:aminopeptidase N [Kocuria sp.]|uniref:aminopeptidase N n=1 Tax=Kocuria sp. TaxID=1871328 RepID=UPI0026DF6AB8|nr:aminopeptidase N [Kocuria sp.]MDO5619798.1 aminopeptidase N [Kocuria sp.]